MGQGEGQFFVVLAYNYYIAQFRLFCNEKKPLKHNIL